MSEYKAMSAEEKAIISREYEICGYASIRGVSNYFEADDETIVTLGKPIIQTSFYFGEHNGEDAWGEARRASKSVEFFIDENLHHNQTGNCYHYTNDETLATNDLWIRRKQHAGQPDECRLGHIIGCWEDDTGYAAYLARSGYRKLNAGEIERLREAERRQAALFEKRLRAYLKRHGLSKVCCSTYWADR